MLSSKLGKSLLWSNNLQASTSFFRDVHKTQLINYQTAYFGARIKEKFGTDSP